MDEKEYYIGLCVFVVGDAFFIVNEDGSFGASGSSSSFIIVIFGIGRVYAVSIVRWVC